jgi:RNA polymerase sigma-70 factor (ECF subfamily)
MTSAVAVALPAELQAAESAIAAAERGEGQGWDWIFDRFYPTVLRYCAARLGGGPLAEDAAQDVFVASVSALSRLRDRSEAGVEGWLLGIARFKCVDRIRTRRRERAGAQPAPAPEDAAVAALSRLAAADVRAALEALGERQREVVIRRFLMDQSLGEVAIATGRPVGAVKSMQHRALAQLARRCGGRRPADPLSSDGGH